jgi:hypothetical protein
VRFVLKLLVALALAAVSVPGFTQGPAAPQNLKVLPKDISTSDLMAAMMQYNSQLGVECAYCHAADPASHRVDFVSDAKPEKQTARLMITMTNELNAKYVSHLPTGNDQRVACGTCHRGHPMPEAFVPPQ